MIDPYTTPIPDHNLIEPSQDEYIEEEDHVFDPDCGAPLLICDFDCDNCKHLIIK